MTDHACTGAVCRLCDHRGVMLTDRTGYVHTPAASANAVGSLTGRVARNAPPASMAAAHRAGAAGHRQIIARLLVEAGAYGVTSIEAAAALPLTAQGGAQVSNRSASRLGELWEAGIATVARRHGACAIGVCQPHSKPATVHRPSAPCDVHGEPITRAGAAVWITA
jgi:hypothetical protein